MLEDVRYACRTLRRSPTVLVVAVATWALGIGATTALFSVVEPVLLRPLPYPEPERLVRVVETRLPQFPRFAVAPATFYHWRDEASAFAALAATTPTTYSLTGAGEPVELPAARVSPGFLTMLGVAPTLGRDLLPAEAEPGRAQVALLAHGLWQRRFGGDPGVVGRQLTLGGVSHTVVGVLPPAFGFPTPDVEVWTPLALGGDQRESHGAHFLIVTGRLAPGVTVAAAQAELVTMGRALERAFPEAKAGWSVRVDPLQGALVREARPTLLVLFGAAGLVLLIACSNVANLLLARAAARRPEIALRTALGASRARIARQLVTESMLLALAGSAAGLGLAVWAVGALPALAPGLPRIEDVGVDARSLVFAVATALAVGVGFGLVPAWPVSHQDAATTLKASGRGGAGRRGRARDLLVVGEIALAVMLLIGAGLLIESLRALTRVDPGFVTDRAVAASLRVTTTREPPQRRAFFFDLIDRLERLPEVEAVGATHVLPFAGNYLLGFLIDGRPRPAPGETPSTNYYAVTPGYFRAMGIPLVRGRLFTADDREGAPRTVIINEAMAARYFADTDPIGERIHVTQGPELFREIVGIVGDTKHDGLDTDAPLQVYEPYAHLDFATLFVVVRARASTDGLAASIRRQVQLIDPDQPVSRIERLDSVVAESVTRERFAAVLLGLFALAALALAAVGIYGVMAYTVTQRTHEIGVRMAVGAGAGRVLRLVVGRGLRLAATGVALGVAGALALGRIIEGLLFEVGARDPLVYTLAPIVLALVALGASLAPARRAARVDPVVALRAE